MSLEQASLISQIISAVAILASLAFLAFQVHGNTQALRSQSYFNGMAHGQRPLELMVADKDLTRIVNTGYNSPGILSQDERERFNLHTFMLFNSWEYFFYQHRDGSIPKQLFIGADAHLKGLVRTKLGLRDFWEEYKHAYAEQFLSYVSAAFDDGSTVPAKSPVVAPTD